MEKAMGYIRVSTKKQAEKGLSLEAQLENIKMYCKLNNFEFKGYKIDKKSAKNLEDRDGASKILKLAREKKIDHIIVYKLERMFRNTIETLQTAAELDKLGVGFHSITEKWDTKSAFGKFSFVLMAGLAEMERQRISERTKDVMDFKKRNDQKVGRYTDLGRTLGTNRDAKDGKRRQQVIDEKEVAAIVLTKELRNTGYTYRKISAILAENGFLSKVNKQYQPSTIKKMLSIQL